MSSRQKITTFADRATLCPKCRGGKRCHSCGGEISIQRPGRTYIGKTGRVHGMCSSCLE